MLETLDHAFKLWGDTMNFVYKPWLLHRSCCLGPCDVIFQLSNLVAAPSNLCGREMRICLWFGTAESKLGGVDMILGVWRWVRMDQQTPFFGVRVAFFATTFKNRKAVPKSYITAAVI